MDKLKAMGYFVAAADGGSFAAAARALDLSVPAIQKGVVALERSIGVRLFERGPQGLTLTAPGAGYLDACRPILQEVASLDEATSRTARQVSGTLTIAAHAQLAHHLLMPALPRFQATHRDVQIDLRVIHRMTDADASPADVFLLHGWPDVPDLVHKPLGLSKTWIVASPQYWAAHGVPETPADLAAHDCLLLRNPAGILLDLWEFQRGEHAVSVPVNGRMSTNGREVLLDATLAGAGVARLNQVTSRSHLQSGRLVPVLLDWEVKGGAPVNLVYRPTARRVPPGPAVHRLRAGPRRRAAA